jgi:hypothetical protein
MAVAKQGGCLAFLFGRKSKQDSKVNLDFLPYKASKSLLTDNELDFYRALQVVVGTQTIVCPKVRIADLIYVPHNTQNSYTFLNKITSKHVDFALCHPQTMQCVLAIELDDASHDQDARRERDSFVDVAFQTAGIKLIHIRAQRSYTPEQVAQRLGAYFNSFNR